MGKLHVVPVFGFALRIAVLLTSCFIQDAFEVTDSFELGVALNASGAAFAPDDECGGFVLGEGRCTLNALQHRAQTQNLEIRHGVTKGLEVQLTGSDLRQVPVVPKPSPASRLKQSLGREEEEISGDVHVYACLARHHQITEVMRPEAKGIALDDSTMERCGQDIPALWPNTNTPLTSLRLFKPWGMTAPKLFHGDMHKSWVGLKTFAKATGAKMLVGVSVTCNRDRDEKEWDAGREFIKFIGADHIMGIAIGNEMDLQVGDMARRGGCKSYSASGSCRRCLDNLWKYGKYFKIFVKRIEEFDAIPGMSGLPVTAIFSAAATGGNPFKYNVKRFVGQAWQKYGSRFVFSINVYPQFSTGLAHAGCAASVNVGTKFTSSGFVPRVISSIRKKMRSIGQGDKKLWIGEVGWATRGYCPLHCSWACRSRDTQRKFYQNFLTWDMQAAEDKADHIFYFTLRDSSVFGEREEFGIVEQCGSPRCKF